MSTTTVLNTLPNHLRDELKGSLYKEAFTNNVRVTVRESHKMLVPDAAEAMMTKRQKRLYENSDLLSTTEKIDLLTELEMLRYFLALLKKES